MIHILRKGIHTILWVEPASVHTSAAFEVVSQLVLAQRGVLQDVPLSGIGPQAMQTAREKYREIVSTYKVEGFRRHYRTAYVSKAGSHA
jgi:hypothetical protein